MQNHILYNRIGMAVGIIGLVLALTGPLLSTISVSLQNDTVGILGGIFNTLVQYSIFIGIITCVLGLLSIKRNEGKKVLAMGIVCIILYYTIGYRFV